MIRRLSPPSLINTKKAAVMHRSSVELKKINNEIDAKSKNNSNNQQQQQWLVRFENKTHDVINNSHCINNNISTITDYLLSYISNSTGWPKLKLDTGSYDSASFFFL